MRVPRQKRRRAPCKPLCGAYAMSPFCILLHVYLKTVQADAKVVELLVALSEYYER